MKQYFQTGAAARECNLSEQWIRQLADDGKVKTIRTTGGARLYDADDIRKLAILRNEKRRDQKRS
jgi:DNA-binding transcriptional MerR regulator